VVIDIIRECANLARRQRAAVSRVKTTQVSREDIRNGVRGLVDGYFRTDRPLILEEIRDTAALEELDTLMQDLLRLGQSRALKQRYMTVLRQLEQAWNTLERIGMPIATPLIGLPVRSPRQETIIRTLEAVCAPASLCYQQALQDLSDSARRSWRGTAAELREALRELLDKIAPDDEVSGAPGFKLEAGTTGPTMKQKARFVLRSRRQSDSERKPIEDAAQTVEDNVGAFVRSAYVRSSVSVHTEPERRDVVSVLRFVELVFLELLELDV
jgi:hypothetical protein